MMESDDENDNLIVDEDVNGDVNDDVEVEGMAIIDYGAYPPDVPFENTDAVICGHLWH